MNEVTGTKSEQLNETTSLLEPVSGDALCSDPAFQMQASLPHAGHESASYGDGWHTGHNAEPASGHQSHSCGY